MKAPHDERTTVGSWALAVLAALLPSACERIEESAPLPPTVMTKSGIEMVVIPAGWFEMGGAGGRDDEAPVHRVWVDAFLMDRCEITQRHYGKLVLGNPSHFKGPDHPVEQVSWADAAWYCNKRSRAEGLQPCYNEETAECHFDNEGYRLPTEAEWEYACRAGTQSDRHVGPDPRRLTSYAWYKANAGKTTHPVATRKPNPWGLYDTYGNVAEWCNDVYKKGYYAESPARNPTGPTDGERYVLRGGSWNSGPDTCRSAFRTGEDPGFQDACFSRDAIGFRCVRRAPAAGQPETSPPSAAGAVITLVGGGPGT